MLFTRKAHVLRESVTSLRGITIQLEAAMRDLNDMAFDEPKLDRTTQRAFDALAAALNRADAQAYYLDRP